MLAYYTVKVVSIPMMYGMIMMIIPLIPALNILFPVGTILAERLLFIPSIGFTLIVGEILTVDLGTNTNTNTNTNTITIILIMILIGEVWIYIGRYELTIIKGMNSLSLLLLPILFLASFRVITR